MPSHANEYNREACAGESVTTRCLQAVRRPSEIFPCDRPVDLTSTTKQTIHCSAILGNELFTIRRLLDVGRNFKQFQLNSIVHRSPTLEV